MRTARESFPLRVFPTEIKQQVHLTSWMELYADPSRSLHASACFFHRRINRESRVFLPVFHHRIRCENRVFLRVFHRRIRCESRAAAQLSTQNPPKTLIMLIRQRDKVNSIPHGRGMLFPCGRVPLPARLRRMGVFSPEGIWEGYFSHGKRRCRRS